MVAVAWGKVGGGLGRALQHAMTPQPLTDAVVGPQTVVVEPGHTAVAYQTVLGADWLPHLPWKESVGGVSGRSQWEEYETGSATFCRHSLNMSSKTVKSRTSLAHKAAGWSAEGRVRQQ